MKKGLLFFTFFIILSMSCSCGSSSSIIKNEEPNNIGEVIPVEIDISVQETESEIVQEVTNPAPIYMSYDEYFSKERPFFYYDTIDNIHIEYQFKEMLEPLDKEVYSKYENIYFCEIYNDDKKIYENLINSFTRDEYNIYVIQVDDNDNRLGHVLHIDYEGNVEEIFTNDNPADLPRQLCVYDNVMFFCSGKKIYRYYAPDDILEVFFEVPFYTNNYIYWPNSTTDIRYIDNGGITKEGSPQGYNLEPEPGTKSDTMFFYSSLTGNSYNSYYLRATNSWHIFTCFYMNYLDTYLSMDDITNFEQYKEKYIVPRGESLDALRLYNIWSYTLNTQYLKKRGEDLVVMSIDPHEISTFRYPEDDEYFFDPTWNYWSRQE